MVDYVSWSVGRMCGAFDLRVSECATVRECGELVASVHVCVCVCVCVCWLFADDVCKRRILQFQEFAHTFTNQCFFDYKIHEFQWVFA